MAIELTAAGFRKVLLDTPESEGWVDRLNENQDLLQAMNATGGLAVRARDLDPVTFLPTSRYFQVASGLIRAQGGILIVPALFDQLAPPGGAIDVWLDVAGNLSQGATFPNTYPYIPLAYITTDATRITAITDYRHPLRPVGGPLEVTRVAVAASYTQLPGVNYIRVDATGGARTVTLAAPALNAGQLIYVRKVDTSANAVTIASTALIDGAASQALAARGTMILVSTGTTYEVVA